MKSIQRVVKSVGVIGLCVVVFATVACSGDIWSGKIKDYFGECQLVMPYEFAPVEGHFAIFTAAYYFSCDLSLEEQQQEFADKGYDTNIVDSAYGRYLTIEVQQDGSSHWFGISQGKQNEFIISNMGFATGATIADTFVIYKMFFPEHLVSSIIGDSGDSLTDTQQFLTKASWDDWSRFFESVHQADYTVQYEQQQITVSKLWWIPLEPSTSTIDTQSELQAQITYESNDDGNGGCVTLVVSVADQNTAQDIAKT